MRLWACSFIILALSFVYGHVDDDVCSCSSDSTCALVPPADRSSFPCYQGSLEDAINTYKFDPLLPPKTTWACGTCLSQGYPVYLRNDPIFTSMGLWSNSSTFHQSSEDVCECNTNQNCSLIPPESSSSFPCYQGSLSDASFTYKTDPLLASGTTWSCGNCEDFGYPTYLRHDPIYRSMELWSKSSDKTPTEKVCSCSSSVNCSLIPPTGSTFPCYQGTPSDAAFTYATDPLIVPETTWVCDNCANNGYPVYLRNDPIYLSMELWAKSSSHVPSESVCTCTGSQNCSLIPPETSSSFPCYQGTPSDASFCYKTDPLLASGTTWSCGNCDTYGYSTYLRNDPIYRTMGLWSKSSQEELTNALSKLFPSKTNLRTNPVVESLTKICSSCLLDINATCSLIPSIMKHQPCIEGSPAQIIMTYDIDILFFQDTVSSCSSCASNGYETFISEDPLGFGLKLWGK